MANCIEDYANKKFTLNEAYLQKYPNRKKYTALKYNVVYSFKICYRKIKLLEEISIQGAYITCNDELMKMDKRPYFVYWLPLKMIDMCFKEGRWIKKDSTQD